MGCRKRGVGLQQNFATSDPGAYFDHFCMCLALCVPEAPWEVGEGGRWEGQTTRIFPPGKPFLPEEEWRVNSEKNIYQL